jgi:hypothetical protein
MPRKKLKEFIIPCRLTYTGEVIVKGTDEDDALERFERGEFEYEDRQECVNWEAKGNARPNE